MIRKRLGRLATVFTASAMALLLLGVGTVSASTPGWTGSNAVAILDSVGPGKDAGFTVTLKNDGPGNISTLYLKADKAASYVSDSRCVTAPTLYCSFGAQNVDQTITFKVAFTVGSAGSFTVNFSESANGFTGSDKGHNSRGDVNPFAGTASVTTGGGNFDGGVNVGGDTYADDQSVGRNNVQATKLENAPDLAPVTIQDGGPTFACNAGTHCAHLIGEWSKLTVGDGTVGPIKVTILVYGNSVSGNPDPSTLFLLHTTDAGVTNWVHDQCTYTDGVVNNADCLAGLPTKVGKNYQIVAWLATNGGIRGGF